MENLKPVVEVFFNFRLLLRTPLEHMYLWLRLLQMDYGFVFTTLIYLVIEIIWPCKRKNPDRKKANFLLQINKTCKQNLRKKTPKGESLNS